MRRMDRGGEPSAAGRDLVAALVLVSLAVLSAALPGVSSAYGPGHGWALTPAAPNAQAPSRLQELEQKMEALQVSSERFTLTTALTGEKLPRALGGLFGELSASGEVTLSPEAGQVTVNLFGKPLVMRLVGGVSYLYVPELSEHDHGRPWIKLGRKPFSELLRSSSGGVGAVTASSKPAFAGELKLIKEATALTEVGATTVDGQEVTHFTGIFNPAKAEKAPRSITVKTARGRRVVHVPPIKQSGRLELFIAPNGLPVRTILAITTSAGTAHRTKGVTVTVTLDIPAINFPLVVEAPPASETITLAQLKALEKKTAKKRSTPKKR